MTIRIIISRPLWEFVSVSRLCPLMITGRGWFETGTHGDIGRCLSQRYGAIRIIISRPLWEFVSCVAFVPVDDYRQGLV